MLEKHYSTDIDLSDKVFSLAEKQLYYFYNTLAKINAFSNMYGNNTGGKVIDNSVIENVEKSFIDSMDDDFNSAAAISDMFSVCKYVNTLITSKQYQKEDISVTLTQLKEKVKQQFSLIGLFQESPEKFVQELRNKHLNHLRITASYIEGLILQRNDAKANKNYEIADRIRNSLLEKGIILNDSKDGTSWDVKELYSIGA